MLRALVYRVCYAIACASGSLAVRLGSAFRALGARDAAWGPVVVLAQLPVALLWLAARGVFVASAAPCFALGRSGTS